MTSFKDTMRYRNGFEAGRRFAGWQHPADADQHGRHANTLRLIVDFRDDFDDASWEAWTGDEAFSKSEYKPAVSLYSHLFETHCEVEDSADGVLQRALLWWAWALATDSSHGAMVVVWPEELETLTNANFIKGWIDGAVDTYKRWPGKG